MAVKVASVEFDLVTNVAKFMDDFKKASDTSEKEMKKITSSMEKGAAAFKGFGNAVTAGLVVTAAISGLKELSSQIDESEKGLAQVRASLNSTGGAAGVTEQQVVSLADSIKKMTSVDDDAIVSMEGVLLTFTKIHKEVFPAATQAIVDLSAKMGQDLQTSAVQVGKALNDPVKGVTALQKIGVSFTESQKDVIKKLAETGHVAEAQKIILRELGEEFGGSAAAARNTFGGALEALNVRIGDVWQSIGGSQGLRTGVEALIIVMEKAAVGVKELSDPTTKMGKDMQTFGLVLIETGKSLMMYTNMAIYGAQLLGEKVAPVFAIFEPGIKKVGDALNWAGGYFQKFHKESKAAFDTGLIPNYFKGVEKAFEEAKKRMIELDALAAKSKPRPQGVDDTGMTKADKVREKAAEKAAKELDKERKSVGEIVRAYELKAQQFGEIDKKQEQLNQRIEIERQISSKANVPLKERLAAINQIGAAYKQMQEDETRNEVKKQGESLQSELDTMREQLATAKAKKTIEDSMIPIWQAEENLKKLTKGHEKENLALQQQIRDAAKEQAQQAIEEKHQDALKTMQEITSEYEKQRQVAEDKVKGQEDINQLLKDEKKIRENIRLTQEEKDDAVARIKAADAATRSLNKQYEAQKKIIKDIVSSKDSDVAKTKKLAEALADGTINAKEYQDAVDGLNTSASKTASIGSQLSSAFGNAFNSFISGGSKATDIMKNLGKEIATLAAKKLLLEPIEKMLGNWAKGIFGAPSGGAVGGGNAQQTSWLGALGKTIPMIPGVFNSVAGGMQSGLINTGGSVLGGIGGAVSGGASFIAKLLGWQTGGPFGQDRDYINVAENGLELVWPGGYGSADPYLAGLNGPETYYTGGRGGYVSNAQDTSRLLTNQDIALSAIGAWRQKAQDALTAGRPLSYWELQEGNAQAFDTYKRSLDWNSSDEMDLAKVMDGIKRAEGNDYIEKDRNNSDISFNWRAIKANEMSQDGGGHERAVAAGGRALFADGNQQRELLARADALNIPVPDSLRNKGGLMADVWNQQDTISGGTAFSRSFFNLMGTYGGSGGHSMGMGAGEGTTNNGAVYGGDFWDARTGANSSERDDLLGAKDWQWQKFHNANLSFGGGNYIGDANYGKSNRGYDFQGPTRGGPSEGSYTSGTPDDGANLTRLVEHWTKNGIKGAGLDQLIKMFGGTLPPTAQQDFDRRGYRPQMGTLEGYINNPSKYADFNSGSHGGGVYQAPHSGSVPMGSIGLHDNGLRRIESHINGIGFGGAVGAPGQLSTNGGSYGDVFDQQTTIRASNPYYNMADGFDQGYFNARNGSDVGATKPRGGWALSPEQLFSGGRALGGRVNAGRLYEVAERGNELFLPEKAGNVIPFDKLKGAGNGPAVVINNNALPASDVHVSNQNGKEVITLLKTAIMADPRSQAALESRYGVRPRSAMSG